MLYIIKKNKNLPLQILKFLIPSEKQIYKLNPKHMKKYFYILIAMLAFSSFSYSQTAFYTEDFETYDTNHLPAGWYSFSNMQLPLNYPYSNWTVRDSGKYLPGITFSPGRGQRSYSGLKALGVTWYTCIDTSQENDHADAWLVTKRFNNIPSDCYVSFYACGGSTNYGDSMEVLVNSTDSLVSHFQNIQTLYWPNGSTFGAYTLYFFDLSSYAHQNVRIAFRYVSSNNTSNGFAVMLDYFQMFGTVGISQIGTNIPTKFDLKQNYPNPFNPSTKIRFDLAKSTNVKLEIYNNLGQVVKTLVNEYKPAGYYETDFSAINLPSGAYFYRLTTDYYSDIKKMVVVK